MCAFVYVSVLACARAFVCACTLMLGPHWRVRKGAERFGQKSNLALKEETVIVIKQVKKKAFGAVFVSEGSKSLFGDMMRI